ncbi:MAG: glycoside hydrolase family 43 protein [Planctomycetota bacterium]
MFEIQRRRRGSVGFGPHIVSTRPLIVKLAFMQVVALLTLFLVTLLIGCAAPAATYTNPVGELRMGDPFVARYGNTFYLTGTTHASRGFAGWRSDDLVTWQPLGMLHEKAEDGWPRRSMWAPELFERGGRYFLAHSARGVIDGEERYALALAVADNPAGPYETLHAPWADDGHAAIDAHVFQDDDGTPYLYYARVAQPGEDGKPFASIWCVQLAEDLSRAITKPVECVRAQQPWETPADGLSICNEGPFVFREGERYFMTFSAGHWADKHYAIGYAVADHPQGPWHKPADNPLAATGMAEGVSGPGHCSIVTTPAGERWMVYHAHADPETPRGPRTVNLDPLRVEGGRLVLDGPTRTPRKAPRLR